MTSAGQFSSRHKIPVPGDGQDEPADDSTAERNIADANTENWGDIIQTILLSDSFLDGKLVSSGNLLSRPSASASAPKLYVVVDGGESGDQPYLTYNDDTEWHHVGEVRNQKSIDDTDSPYSIAFGESLWVNALTAAVNVQLPAPDAGGSLRVIVVDSTNTTTLLRNGTETIDGVAGDLALDEEGFVELESDGTNWRTSVTTSLQANVAETITAQWTFDGGLLLPDDKVITLGDGGTVEYRLWYKVSEGKLVLQAVDGAVVSTAMQFHTDGLSEFINNAKVPDDAPIFFGTGRDVHAEYNSTSGLFEISDGTTVYFTLDPVNGHVDVPNGELRKGSVEVQSKIEAVIDSPNGHIPTALLEAGESAELAIPVPDGETLTVYRWGGFKLADGTAPTGLDVELLDDADVVQTTENTVNTENTAGVASLANASGTLSIFKLRVANDTGGDLITDGVAAIFGYVVE